MNKYIPTLLLRTSASILFSFMLALPATSQAPCLHIQDGLVAYYPFDNNATDASGNSNDGNLIGNPVYETGVFGSSIRMDGEGDYISVPASASLNAIGQAYTIAAWIKVDEWFVNSAVAFASIVNKGVENISSRQFFFGIEEDAMHTLTGSCGVYNAPSPFMALNEWRFVAVTFDTETNLLEFYLDGMPLTMGMRTCGDALVANNHPMHIGRDISGLDEFLNGWLDELRIYGRALSAGEIQALYGICDCTDLTEGFAAPGLAHPWITLSPNSDSGLELVVDAVTGEDELLITASPLNGGSDLWPAYNFNAPRLLRPVSGNWIAETKMHFHPTSLYEGAGFLVVMDDEPGSANLQRFNELSSDNGQAGLRMVENFTPYSDTLIWLRLEKQGNTYFTSHSSDGMTWVETGSMTLNEEARYLGLTVIRQPHDGNLNDYGIAGFGHFSLTCINDEQEICDDGQDNDNDGLVDCGDPDCSSFCSGPC